MFVYNPKTLFDAWPVFYAFVDFMIRLINEDKVRIEKRVLYSDLGGFDIYLLESKGVADELKVNFDYDDWRGRFVGRIKPIQRFRFSLIKSAVVIFDVESRNTLDYDKMLELFKVVVAYLKRHDPEDYARVLKSVDLSSLERSSWKKSRKEIEREFNEKWETRQTTEDFERKRNEELSKLTSDYKSQGYEITD